MTVSSPQRTPEDELVLSQAAQQAVSDDGQAAGGLSAAQAQEEAEEAQAQSSETSETNEETTNPDNLRLRFLRDEDTGRDLFQLVEPDSGEVVRQIPPENLLEFIKRFEQVSGNLFSGEA